MLYIKYFIIKSHDGILAWSPFYRLGMKLKEFLERAWGAADGTRIWIQTCPTPELSILTTTSHNVLQYGH